MHAQKLIILFGILISPVAYSDDVPDSIGDLMGNVSSVQKCMHDMVLKSDMDQNEKKKFQDLLDEIFDSLLIKRWINKDLGKFKTFEESLTDKGKINFVPEVAKEIDRLFEGYENGLGGHKGKKLKSKITPELKAKYKADLFACVEKTDLSPVYAKLEGCHTTLSGPEVERLSHHGSVMLGDKEPTPMTDFMMKIFGPICDRVAGVDQFIICNKGSKNHLYTKEKIEFGPREGCDRLIVFGARVHCLKSESQGKTYRVMGEYKLNGENGRDCASVANPSGGSASDKTLRRKAPAQDRK